MKFLTKHNFEAEKLRGHIRRFLLPGLFLFIFSFLFLSYFFPILAAPPTTPYTPGETLDPSCSPGDTNCTVRAPVSASGTVAKGHLLVTDGNASSTWYLLATSTDGKVLTVSSTATYGVSWESLPASVTTYLGLSDTPSTFTAKAIPYTNSAGTALLHSANFVFDGTNLGIGTSTPSTVLTVNGTSTFLYSPTSPGTGAQSERFGYGALAGGTAAVAFGKLASSPGFYGISIGYGNTASGNSSIAIGDNATAAYSPSIAIGGYAAPTAANQVVIGGSFQDDNRWFGEFYLGGGVTSGNIHSVLITTTGGSGSNVAGWPIAIAGGKGTGTGLGGSILFRTASSTTSGSTLNTLITRMAIDQSGNVGIGTSTPISLLHIYDATSAPAIALDYGGTSGKRFLLRSGGAAAGSFDIYDNASATSRLTIDSNGFVGIGTSTPSTFFTVASGTTNFLNITSAGNVGIGTTTPSSLLTIASSTGSALFTLSTAGAIGAATIPASQVTAGTFPTGEFVIPSRLTLGEGGPNTPSLRLGNSGGGGRVQLYGYTDTLVLAGAGSNTADVAIRPYNQSGANQSAGSLSIQGGIGTGTGLGGSILFRTASSTTSGSTLNTLITRMAIDQSGNVGIGTSTPISLLHIYDATSAPAIALDYGGTSGKRFLLRSGGAAASSFDIYDNASATSRLTIATDGKIGIGTTTPSASFYVMGDAFFEGDGSVPNAPTSTGFGFGKSASDTNRRMEIVTPASGSAYIDFTNPSTDYKGRILYDTASNYLSLYANAVENVRIYNNAINFGNSFTTTNAIRNFNFISTTSIMRIQTVSASMGTAGPTLELIHSTTANGTADSYWDIYGGTSDSFNIRQRTGGTNNVRISVDSNGNVGVGTTTPQDALHVIGDIRTSACASDGAGDVNCVDVAESYPAGEYLEAGDVVSFTRNPAGSASTSPYAIKKSEKNKDAIGIVSTRPGLYLEGEKARFGGPILPGSYNAGENAPVALAGRVPVKISLENGDINVGDPLTLSSEPGKAMKAKVSGKILGYALDEYTSSSETTSTPKILAFVTNSYWFQTEAEIQEDNGTNIVSGFGASVINGLREFGLEIKKDILKIKEIVVQKLTAEKIVTNEFEIKDADTGEIYCVRLRSGEWDKTLGECSEKNTSNSQKINSQDVPADNTTSSATENQTDNNSTGSGSSTPSETTSSDVLPETINEVQEGTSVPTENLETIPSEQTSSEPEVSAPAQITE